MKKPTIRKKVLLVTPHTIPDFSGSGINAFYFARFLNQQGNQAVVLTFNRNLKLNRRENKEGVPIHRITYFNNNIFTKILSLIFILPAYLVHVIRNQVVIIFGAHIIGFQAIILLCKVFNRKVVFRSLLIGSDDASTLLRDKSRFSRWIYRSLFRSLDLYFSINPVFEERFRLHMGDIPKILTSPQGVDTEVFHLATNNRRNELRNQYGYDHETHLILSVGFLINRKGFMKVFSTLGGMDYDFRYILVGDYEFPRGHFLDGKKQEAEIIRQDGILALGEKLILAGSSDQIRDYYQMCDLVLINSVREGMPNTLLEAMACGKPVLIRNLPGISNIVSNLESGIIYEDLIQMEDWLQRLYNEPELRQNLGEQARLFIEESATFASVWEKMRVYF